MHNKGKSVAYEFSGEIKELSRRKNPSSSSYASHVPSSSQVQSPLASRVRFSCSASGDSSSSSASKIRSHSSTSKVRSPSSDSKVRSPSSASKVRSPSSDSKVRSHSSTSKVRSPSSASKVSSPRFSSSSSSRSAAAPGSSNYPFASRVQSSSPAYSSIATAAQILSPNPFLGSVEFTTDINGLEKVVLRGPLRSSAEVYLYGGQVMSWKNQYGEELLFISTKATYAPRKPVRGGIPICFPEFLNMGSIERHGFVRSRLWRIDHDPPPLPASAPVSSCIDLIIDEEERWTWPHKYEFRQRIALGYGGELRFTARIRNIRRDGKPFSFTIAYHPYFSVSDIGEVRVEGVEMSNYLDHLRGKELFTEQGDCITFEEEVDKIYVCTPTKVAVLDHQKRNTIEIRKDHGLLDTIVWNPWDKKAKAIPDLGNQDYKRMLCVGAAAIESPITLKPGQEWKGRMELNFVPTSYVDF